MCVSNAQISRSRSALLNWYIYNNIDRKIIQSIPMQTAAPIHPESPHPNVLLLFRHICGGEYADRLCNSARLRGSEITKCWKKIGGNFEFKFFRVYRHSDAFRIRMFFYFYIFLSFSRHALQQMNIPAHSRPRRIDAAVEYVTRAQSISHWRNFAVDESNQK